jgi:hypothetical protein
MQAQPGLAPLLAPEIDELLPGGGKLLADIEKMPAVAGQALVARGRRGAA